MTGFVPPRLRLDRWQRRQVERRIRQTLVAWEIVTARAVVGLQRDALRVYGAEVVVPVVREVAAGLALAPERGVAISPHTSAGLRAIDGAVEATVQRGMAELRETVRAGLREIGSAQTEWVADRAAAAAGQEVAVADAAAVARAIDGVPFLGRTLDDWFREFLEGPTSAKVRAWVTTGAQRGLSTDEIVRGLTGPGGFLEGQSRHNVESMVLTSATHASSSARQAAFEALGIEKVRWVGTLDSRVCPTCLALDGQVFRIDQGPRPPAHPRCRCSAIPGEDVPDGTRASKDGPVPASLHAAEWLVGASREDQDRVFGATRAAAWRSGSLSLDQMLGPSLDPLTIAELRELGRLR